MLPKNPKPMGRVGNLTSQIAQPESVDQRLLFEGNSVLRGQTPKVGEAEHADVLANQSVESLLID